MSETEAITKRLHALKNALEDENVTPKEASKVLAEILQDFEDSDPVENWSANFFGLTTKTDAITHLQDMFYVYLETHFADNGTDRSEKLFVTKEMVHLLQLIPKIE